MKADITRLTFRSEQHYVATVQQQGRVPLDADWNEQVAIQAHRDEVETVDVIGSAGVPKGDSFLLTVSPDQQDLLLAPGRAYVDGLMAENEGDPIAAVADSAGTVVVPTLAIDGASLRVGGWVQVFTASVAARTYKITAIDTTTLRLTLSVAAGESLVTVFGANVQLRRLVSYKVQPEWPTPDAIVDTGSYVAYLDVWKRHITALDDKGIREVALGGPDTCTRMRLTWQLRLYGLGPGSFTCATAGLPTPLAGGALSARAKQPPDTTTPCNIPASASYRSLENQLYRVEIHKPGVLGDATFKFSIDNGTVVTSVIAQNTSTQLAVGSTGKDTVLGFSAGQWIELIDDTLVLAGEPGTLVKINTVGDGVINLVDPVDLTKFPLNPRLRRWDQVVAGGALTVEQAPDNDGFLVLDASGVQIKFEAGYYNTGDYWMIPARTITRDVEWPTSELGTPLPQPREGIEHHTMKLGVVTWDGTKLTATDCRDQFPPLTDIHASDVVMDPGPCQFPANVKTVQDAISELCKQKENACCELVIVPGDDVQSAIDLQIQRNLANNISGLHVCFAAGTHLLPYKLVVNGPPGSGDITVSGCGLASHVTTTGAVAIQLSGWTTATVRDLTIEAGAPPVQTRGVSGPLKSTAQPLPNAAVLLVDCDVSVVEDASITCGAASRKVTSCIAVQGSGAHAEARIANCDLHVGANQVGITVLGVDRSTVEGNRIDVVPYPSGILAQLVASHDYLGRVRDMMFSDLRIGKAAATTVATRKGFVRVHTAMNDVPLAFTTVSDLGPVWQRFFAAGGLAKMRALRRAQLYATRVTQPAAKTTPAKTTQATERSVPLATSNMNVAATTNADVAAIAPALAGMPNALSSRVAFAMKRLVTKVLRAVSAGNLSQAQLTAQNVDGFAAWKSAIDAQAAAVMNTGIAVGGPIGNDVRVLDNSIRTTLTGITAALTAQTLIAQVAPRLGRVRIAGNSIDLAPPRTSHGRHTGIYVASSTSLTIEDNYTRNTIADATCTGIHVTGLLGKLMRVDGNHTVQATTGIHIVPQTPSGAHEPNSGALWILSQNVAESTTTPIDVWGPASTVIKINNAP